MGAPPALAAGTGMAETRAAEAEAGAGAVPTRRP